MKSIYLDYAAATPMDPSVEKAMEPYFSEQFYNPSAIYLNGREVRQALENARSDIAGCLGSKPAEIIFTGGATEANNLAIQGVMRCYPDSEILVSAIEHESVLEPAALFKFKRILVNNTGEIILDKSSTSDGASNLSELIADKTVLISVGYVNNEIGTIQPLRQISALIEKVMKQRQTQKNPLPLYLHTDAAQAPNYFDLHVSQLGVDLMSINGDKIYGPKQSGVLYVKTGVQIGPLILGGGQESGLRSGTENVASAVGLAAALQLSQKTRKTEQERINNLRTIFINELQKRLPNATFNGSKNHSAPHILSVTLPGSDNERLMMELDELGVQAATGSACAASNDEPSHVLSAVGLSDDEARSTLRFSMGRQTTKKNIYYTAGLLVKLLN